MTRQQKYPDTKTFHFFNANPKGRITGDCVYRALTVATGKKWEEMIFASAYVACTSGYSPGSTETMGKVLESFGFVRMQQPKKANGRKYTGKEFCRKIAKSGCRYVANIGCHHVVAIADCKVWDIWDSSDDCIGVYWVKEEKG